MPNYNYECLTCKKKALKKHADKLEEDGSGKKSLPLELYEELVLFETSHSMNPSDEELHEATECPRCGGHNVNKTFHGSNIRTRCLIGSDWKHNPDMRRGLKRDLDRYKLANDDPYGEYRQDGEVDHIDSQLKKEGLHNPKTKYFTKAGGMDKAVEKAVSTPSPKSDE
jgi:hypothetical protein